MDAVAAGLATFGVSMVPELELRAGIPLGVAASGLIFGVGTHGATALLETVW
jgi:hypothetical protein